MKNNIKLFYIVIIIVIMFNLFKIINLKVFLISLFVGLLFMYLNDDKSKIICNTINQKTKKKLHVIRSIDENGHFFSFHKQCLE